MNELLSKSQLAKRWGCSPRTLDRLREAEKLPWLDLSRDTGGRKPLVRFRPADIITFEESRRQGGRGDQ